MLGRKRHLLVDTLGPLLTVMVTAADVPDVDGAYELVPAAKAVAPTLAHVWVDGGYQGDWAAWAQEERGVAVQPRRWVVEVSHSWFSRFRRLLIRWDTRADHDRAFAQLAACLIIYRKLRHARLLSG